MADDTQAPVEEKKEEAKAEEKAPEAPAAEAPADAKAVADKPKVEEKKEEKKEEAPKVEDQPKADQPEAGKKDVEVPKKFKSLVDEIEKMSVLDLSELVSILEDKFGVSAAAPAMMMAPTGVGAGGDAGAPAEEKTEFNVELTEAGGTKIAVIKAVKAATGLGLADAKALVDGAPKVIKENVKKEEAEELKKTIEEAGGTVTLK